MGCEHRALELPIRTIAAETEKAFTSEALWPPHPLDEEDA